MMDEEKRGPLVGRKSASCSDAKVVFAPAIVYSKEDVDIEDQAAGTFYKRPMIYIIHV